MDEDSAPKAAPPKPEGWDQREMTQEIRDVLAAHKQWLDTNKKISKKNGTKTRLEGYDFSYLDLSNVNLQQALLNNADFQGADLTGANFRGAELANAKFAQANLHRADLSETNLRDADLSEATNLLGGQLAGADLANARLPEAVGKFEDLDNIAEASKNTAKVFLTLLAACFLSWLTVAITTDIGLLTNSAISTLPVIGVTLPIVGFYVAAPIILLAVYVYFHINWARLWEGMANLPAVFPDKRRLDQVVYPWFLNSIVCRYLPRLGDHKPPFFRSQLLVIRILAWGLVPFTIAAIWMRYLTRQEWLVTLVIIGLLVAAMGFGIRSYFMAGNILRRRGRSHFILAACLGATFLLFIACMVFSFGVIYGISSYKGRQYSLIADKNKRDQNEEKIDFINIPCEILRAIDTGSYSKVKFKEEFKEENCFYAIKAVTLRRMAPALFFWRSSGPFANLEEADVSSKPVTWREGKKEEELRLVKGAPLKGRSLRFAHAEGAFLVNADLRWAQMHKAFLDSADLRYARLEMANLQMADLTWADLHEANLQGAHLEGAIRLTIYQLWEARNWPLAFLDPEIIRKLELPKNHNERLAKTHPDLSKYPLQKANLQGARLQEFNLQEAKLQGADLRWANLLEADLTGANLTGANLEAAELGKAKLIRARLNNANLAVAFLGGAELQDADLRGVDLRQARDLNWKQIKSARTDQDTKLPDYLKSIQGQ